MRIAVLFGIVAMTLGSLGCGGRLPEDLGAREGILAPCPDKPNCVSSFATDEVHQIAALAIEGSPEATWQSLQQRVEETPRAEIVTSSGNYMHVVYTSTVMRYRDDVEFLLRPGSNEIAVRSASRVGYGDMGVNRARIEAIRDSLVGLRESSAADSI